MLREDESDGCRIGWEGRGERVQCFQRILFFWIGLLEFFCPTLVWWMVGLGRIGSGSLRIRR